MASKPFIAARIPENLNLKLEEHSKTTGEGRTQTLINALSTYLDFAPETESKENAGDRLSLLEAKVAELERIVKEPQQISLLETSTVTARKPVAEVKPDNTSDNKPDNNSDKETGHGTNTKSNKLDVIEFDNKTDNIQLVTTEEQETENHSPQICGEFIGTMKTSEVMKLPGLEDKDPKKMQIKLNNSMKAKVKEAQIGFYAIALSKAVEETFLGKRRKLLWDVYKNANETPVINAVISIDN